MDISGGAAYLPPGWQNRWYLKVYAAAYIPESPGSANREILTSQRVLWNGHFNEVEGMELS